MLRHRREKGIWCRRATSVHIIDGAYWFASARPQQDIHEDRHVYQALAKTQKVDDQRCHGWPMSLLAARLNRAELSTNAETSVVQEAGEQRICTWRASLATMLLLATMTSRALLPIRIQRITELTPALSSFNAMHAVCLR